MILKIDNKRLDHFNEFALTLNYDGMSSLFSFNLYFNPNNVIHKQVFKPLEFRKVTVEDNNELLITGEILNTNFTDAAVKSLTAIGGYSLTGVLENSDIPTSLYPLQSDTLSLKEIAQKLIKPFGINMIIDPIVSADMDKTYISSTADHKQSIKGYLASLASQRHIIMSHTNKGELLFTRAKTKMKPILDLEQGIPGVKMTLSNNGQEMHSSITVMKQADSEGGNAGQYSIANPYIKRFKPKVKEQTSGNDISTSEAARTALSEELKNIRLTIETDRWIIDNKIIRPNNIISVKNPELYLYEKTNFFIESVNYSGDEKKTTAIINCGLPQVYDMSKVVNIYD